MPRVGIDFLGESRQAVAAARATRRELGEVKTAAERAGGATVASADKMTAAQAKAKIEAIKLARAQNDVRVAAGHMSTEQAKASSTALRLEENQAKAVIQADRLTAAEQKVSGELTHVATRSEVAAVKLSKVGRDANRAERGLLRATTAGTHFGKALSFASNAFLGGAAIGFGVKAVVDAGKEAQTSQALLQNATERSRLSWKRYGGTLVEIAKQQTHLGFARPEVMQSLGNLIRATGNVRESVKDLGIAENIARARRTTLTAVTQKLLMAEQGRFQGLARYGLHIVKVTTWEDKLRDAHVKVSSAVKARAKAEDNLLSIQATLAASQNTFAGAAEKYAHAAAGSTDRLHASVDELEISIGKGLLPAIAPLIDRLAKWVQRMADSGEATRKVKEIVRGTGKVIHELKPAFEAAWGAAKTGIGILRTIAKLVGGWGNLFKLVLAGILANKFLNLATAIGKSRLAMILLGTTAKEQSAIVAGSQGLGAVGASADTAAGKVGKLRGALSLLSKLGRIVVTIAIVEEIIKGITGKGIQDSVAPDVHRGSNPYPVGTYAYQDWQRGYQGKGPPAGINRGSSEWRYYQQGLRARSSGGGGGYINPYSGFAGTDQGTDWTMKGPIGAIGNAKIIRSERFSFRGGSTGKTLTGWIVSYKLLDGPRKGQVIYVAENLKPAKGIHPGAVVQKGQTVAVAGGVWPYIETGFADKAGHYGSTTYAQGKEFYAFLQSLKHGGGGPTGLGPGPGAPGAPPDYGSKYPHTGAKKKRATEKQRIIRAINEELRGTPMAGEGEAFYNAANRYGVDPFHLVAIAGAETTFGRAGTGRASAGYGAFGVGPGRRYGSYEAAIADAARTLGGRRYRGKSLTEQTTTWVGHPAATYERTVASIMDKLKRLSGSTGAGGGSTRDSAERGILAAAKARAAAMLALMHKEESALSEYFHAREQALKQSGNVSGLRKLIADIKQKAAKWMKVDPQFARKLQAEAAKDARDLQSIVIGKMLSGLSVLKAEVDAAQRTMERTLKLKGIDPSSVEGLNMAAQIAKLNETNLEKYAAKVKKALAYAKAHGLSTDVARIQKLLLGVEQDIADSVANYVDSLRQAAEAKWQPLIDNAASKMQDFMGRITSHIDDAFNQITETGVQAIQDQYAAMGPTAEDLALEAYQKQKAASSGGGGTTTAGPSAEELAMSELIRQQAIVQAQREQEDAKTALAAAQKLGDVEAIKRAQDELDFAVQKEAKLRASTALSAEDELKVLEQMQTRQHDIWSVSDAQEALAKAMKLGDPALIREAQRALYDAQTQQQMDALQEQIDNKKEADQAGVDSTSDSVDEEEQRLQELADASHETRQRQMEDAITAYQRTRDAAREVMDDQIGDLNQQLADGKISYDTWVTDVNKILTDNGLPTLQNMGTLMGKGFADSFMYELNKLKTWWTEWLGDIKQMQTESTPTGGGTPGAGTHQAWYIAYPDATAPGGYRTIGPYLSRGQAEADLMQEPGGTIWGPFDVPNYDAGGWVGGVSRFQNGRARVIVAHDGEAVLNPKQQRDVGVSRIQRALGRRSFSTGGVVGTFRDPFDGDPMGYKLAEIKPWLRRSRMMLPDIGSALATSTSIPTTAPLPLSPAAVRQGQRAQAAEVAQAIGDALGGISHSGGDRPEVYPVYMDGQKVFEIVRTRGRRWTRDNGGRSWALERR